MSLKDKGLICNVFIVPGIRRVFLKILLSLSRIRSCKLQYED